ncbi:MAG: site-2 protease family protein [Desulfomicrobium escambiense]|nr:site-2 protease family protein [Desulfomicrobium escambiense]
MELAWPARVDGLEDVLSIDGRAASSGAGNGERKLRNMVVIVLGLVGLGIVVLVHELGHFLAARLTGVHVEAFSLGWGPKLAGFTRGAPNTGFPYSP